jgi:hypothetical protein
MATTCAGGPPWPHPVMHVKDFYSGAATDDRPYRSFSIFHTFIRQMVILIARHGSPCYTLSGSESSQYNLIAVSSIERL